LLLLLQHICCSDMQEQALQNNVIVLQSINTIITLINDT
jgi:hypothetical protein